MILYVLRHGETVWNSLKKFQGRTDVPLNDNGRKAAIQTGDALKDVHFDYVFTSPLSRARETADLIFRDRDIDIVVDERLTEISYGSYEGKALGDEGLPDTFYDDMMNGRCFEPPEDGESLEKIYARMKDYYEYLMNEERFRDATIFLSTHGTSGRAFMRNFWGTDDFWHGDVPPNCSFCRIVLNGREIVSLEQDVVLHSVEKIMFFHGDDN